MRGMKLGLLITCTLPLRHSSKCRQELLVQSVQLWRVSRKREDVTQTEPKMAQVRAPANPAWPLMVGHERLNDGFTVSIQMRGGVHCQ